MLIDSLINAIRVPEHGPLYRIHVCVCFKVEGLSGQTLSERPVSHVCTYGIHFSSSGSKYTIPQRLTVAGEATAKS